MGRHVLGRLGQAETDEAASGELGCVVPQRHGAGAATVGAHHRKAVGAGLVASQAGGGAHEECAGDVIPIEAGRDLRLVLHSHAAGAGVHSAGAGGDLDDALAVVTQLGVQNYLRVTSCQRRLIPTKGGTHPRSRSTGPRARTSSSVAASVCVWPWASRARQMVARRSLTDTLCSDPAA